MLCRLLLVLSCFFIKLNAELDLLQEQYLLQEWQDIEIGRLSDIEKRSRLDKLQLYLSEFDVDSKVLLWQGIFHMLQGQVYYGLNASSNYKSAYNKFMQSINIDNDVYDSLAYANLAWLGHLYPVMHLPIKNSQHRDFLLQDQFNIALEGSSHIVAEFYYINYLLTQADYKGAYSCIESLKNHAELSIELRDWLHNLQMSL